MHHFAKSIDEIDAAVFSGDALESVKNRKLLAEHCESWLRAISEHEVQPVDNPEFFDDCDREGDDLFPGGYGEAN